MSISPDYTDFVDLTIYDKDPTDIYEAAIAVLQSRIPDWTPASTNIEVMLLEALAVEVSETVFNINRIPQNMLRVLLALYGVVQGSGTPPTVDLTFEAYDEDGYVIDAGSEVVITTSTGEAISFFTDAEATILVGDTTTVVSATADVNTNVANGIPINTEVELLDAILGIETVETATVVAGGTLPESVDDWTVRGTQRLRRLVDTLVIPSHFTQAALEEELVYRANTVDNYDPTADPAGEPGDHPGNVTVVVYGDGGPLTSGQKEDLDTSLSERANANLIIHVIDPTIVTVDVTVSIAIVAGFVEADVITAVTARLEEYLSPTTWPWSGTVRRNELISVIDQVLGVEYVGTLTTPAADVVVGADTALTDAGTIVITAV
jgi:hypothetical protein